MSKKDYCESMPEDRGFVKGETVLVRHSPEHDWHERVFSHIYNDKFACFQPNVAGKLFYWKICKHKEEEDQTVSEYYDLEFTQAILPPGIMQRAMDFISSKLSPDEIFTIEQLENWAGKNGYVKDKHAELVKGHPVLVRNHDVCTWVAEIYEEYRHGQVNPFVCMNASYIQCIPYTLNEHLLGTV